ncbi:undecaprenyl-diphosphate phosphatase [Oceanicella actignis]|uniref:Undecaprenyl-diphosphatase n=1 Tax=Oceanicella actignis TaxID=1189325 RepID=A0A1M7TDZ7_9RHOB|nr:undecaprenyl-diphosphate phosphatase [Oceanicella actignis]TYO88608.1 undecaprenyl-diphosphatase [Oceanicella actignis]SET62805.1 Undecaprenyl-diphosphatase [Oceanicella actignis]SHN68962.1 undecaprenyl-diphosphatase [Oceanicella actignis]
MPFLDLILLSIIQGITEFLPISSSAHLILFPALTGEADQGLAVDVSVHVGTLAAVLIYFRAEFAEAFVGAAHVLRGRFGTAQARLALLLALSTLPVVAAGLAVKLSGADEAMRSVEVIAWTTIVFGALLWAADRYAPRRRGWREWSWRDAALMGAAQALALVPGVSRSGVTMTAARWLGYERTDSARLSLLMSAPTIIAAGALTARDLARSGDSGLGLDAAIGAGLSFAAALLALWAMMRMLRSWSMTPFVLYRFALGAALMIYVYA